MCFGIPAADGEPVPLAGWIATRFETKVAISDRMVLPADLNALAATTPAVTWSADLPQR
jgi:hypothetical protein